MERKTNLLILLFSLCAMLAQASYKSEIYEAYVKKDMPRWKLIMERLENVPSRTQAQVLELINYQYGYIGWCLSEDRNEEAKKFIDKVESAALLLEAQNYKVSQANAYLAAIYGFRVSLTPIKAPILGPKSISHAELAMKQDKNNPFGYIQYGNALYYRPKLLGGSKQKALTYFLKAEQLMNGPASKGDWNYLNLLALIGLAYLETDQPKKAEGYFEKALKAEPRFTWVKEELLPKLRNLEKN